MTFFSSLIRVKVLITANWFMIVSFVSFHFVMVWFCVKMPPTTSFHLIPFDSNHGNHIHLWFDCTARFRHRAIFHIEFNRWLYSFISSLSLCPSTFHSSSMHDLCAIFSIANNKMFRRYALIVLIKINTKYGIYTF